ncbi:MAG: hypothetical protein R3C42_05430 [Parvularculaceae bacterium]
MTVITASTATSARYEPLSPQDRGVSAIQPPETVPPRRSATPHDFDFRGENEKRDRRKDETAMALLHGDTQRSPHHAVKDRH